MNSLGVYIGRFQPFHNGHKSVVERMIQENNTCIIFIGTQETDDEKNIFSIGFRSQVISELYPDVKIIALEDNPSDEIWFISLKDIIDAYDIPVCNFYCGDKKNDYSIQVLEIYKRTLTPKEINIIEVPRTITDVSGTQVRELLQKKGHLAIKELVPESVYKKIKAL